MGFLGRVSRGPSGSGLGTVGVRGSVMGGTGHGSRSVSGIVQGSVSLSPWLTQSWTSN